MLKTINPVLTPEEIYQMVSKEFNNQNFKITFERLWELREIDKDLEEEEADEIFCPTDYAFSSSINLLLELYDLVMESFPLGYSLVDSEGGINLVWKCKAQDKEIRLHLPHSSKNIRSSVYFRLNLESRLIEQPSVTKLAKLLQWLVTDDNKLASF